jgi:hypothetical protein
MLSRACQGWAHLLAQVMLGLGMAATLLANALSGLAGGVIGVGVAVWPAVAFVGCIELLIVMAYRRDSAVTIPLVEEMTVTEPAPPVARHLKDENTVRVETVIRDNPASTVKELAQLAGVSDSTIYRTKRGMNGHAVTDATPQR